MKKQLTIKEKELMEKVTARVTGKVDFNEVKQRSAKSSLKKIYPYFNAVLHESDASVIGHIVWKSRITQGLRVNNPARFHQVKNDLLQEGNLYALMYESERIPAIKEKYNQYKNFTILEDLVHIDKYKYIRNGVNKYLYSMVYSGNPVNRQLISYDALQRESGQLLVDMESLKMFDNIEFSDKIGQIMEGLTDREQIAFTALMQGSNYQKALQEKGFSALNSKSISRLKNKVQEALGL